MQREELAIQQPKAIETVGEEGVAVENAFAVPGELDRATRIGQQDMLIAAGHAQHGLAALET